MIKQGPSVSVFVFDALREIFLVNSNLLFCNDVAWSDAVDTCPFVGDDSVSDVKGLGKPHVEPRPPPRDGQGAVFETSTRRGHVLPSHQGHKGQHRCFGHTLSTSAKLHYCLHWCACVRENFDVFG